MNDDERPQTFEEWQNQASRIDFGYRDNQERSCWHAAQVSALAALKRHFIAQGKSSVAVAIEAWERERK